jgi:tripartite-type tricarboxylate transporter receptor subunit TctC
MGPRLGGNLVVDPRGGAGGVIGTQAVARAKPDGYMLLLAATGSQIISPLTHPQPPFDPLKDFTPIALLTRQPMVLAVNPEVPANSLQELIALLRRAPGKYAYASAGTGALGHLTGELFLRQAGNLDVTHVPYKGGGPAITDVIGGNVAYTWEVMSSLIPHHASGKLRIISVADEKRAPAIAQIPTAIEAGLSNFVSLTQQFLLAPAGTPQSVVAQLSKAVQSTMGDPDFRRELTAGGIEPIADSTPASTAQIIGKELDRWRPVVQSLGLRPVE